MQAFACIFFLFFFLFRFSFAKELLQKRCQKFGGAPYYHFHRDVSFPYQLWYYNICDVWKKCAHGKKFLSLCLKLLVGLQNLHCRAKHDLIILVRKRIFDLLERDPLNLRDFSLASLDILLVRVR